MFLAVVSRHLTSLVLPIDSAPPSVFSLEPPQFLIPNVEELGGSMVDREDQGGSLPGKKVGDVYLERRLLWMRGSEEGAVCEGKEMKEKCE